MRVDPTKSCYAGEDTVSATASQLAYVAVTPTLSARELGCRRSAAMADKLAELQYLSLVNKVTTGAWRRVGVALG